MELRIDRQIAIPQDHGSWIFILSPLLIGIFVGGTVLPATAFLILAAVSAYLIRQPITVMVKALSGRRPRSNLRPARAWIVMYGISALIGITGLVLEGYQVVVALAIPGIPIFAWHLHLVSRRIERKQAGVEVLATGVLALAAPAAFWVGSGGYDPDGWWLWLLTWVQAAASIVHAYMRLAQRELEGMPPAAARWRLGGQAVASTSFNLLSSLALGWAGILPPLIFLPFLVQWMETLWCTVHPAVGWKAARIGLRQLAVSGLWTILLVLCWSAR
jgi:hypothetical protein